jgi:Zn-dependent protease with chaperone function
MHKQTVIRNKVSLFERFFSFFLMIFGIITILSLVLFFVYIIYASGFFLLIFLLPIVVGFFIGIFKSSVKPFEIEISEKDHSKLKEIIDELVEKTGVKRPSKIVLKENSQIAVTGLFKKKIIIGLVALKFLDKKDLFTILTHEYGHFAHGDTITGYILGRIEYFFALQEQINKNNLNVYITAIIYGPTFCFFWLLNRFFNITSLWYSRRIEFRADGYSSKIIGEQNYAETFMKYVVISEIFEQVVPYQIVNYLRENLVIKNIYDYLAPIYTQENINKALEISLSRKSGFMDSHPSESERLENLNITEISLDFKKTQEHILENQKNLEEQGSIIFARKIVNAVPLSFTYRSF